MHGRSHRDKAFDVNRLAITSQTSPDGVVVLQIFGELDLYTTTKLDRELEAAFSGGDCGTLIFDLSAVSVLDSTGLRALWTIRHEMREIGGRFVLRAPSDHVLRVLVAAGVESLFEIE